MIHQPTKINEDGFYSQYLRGFTEDDLIDQLNTCTEKTLNLLQGIEESQSEYRYDVGKWRIKQVLRHITDAERVFSYRALHFSRENNCVIPGYDEDVFANEDYCESLTMSTIIEEYKVIRRSSILLYETMNPLKLDNEGKASNLIWTPRIIGWVIAGHNLHHLKVLEERYLPHI